MARIALGVVGAFVGSFFGQPSLGWTIGAAIGGIIDPEVIKSEGPRLGDLKVQFSSWGTMLPILYGSMRLAGNVIWSTPLKETQNTTTDDGKGGPVQENTTYSYSVDIAVSLCEGEITGVRKVWANNNLIYNAGPDANIGTLAASKQIAAGFKVYSGTETQLPDPLMEANKGVGNVPAYRGQAYIVFDDFEVEKYGNRVPNFEFEVVKGSLVPFPWTSSPNTIPYRAMAYGDGKFVSISSYESGVSIDGVIWTAGAMPMPAVASELWSSIAFGAGKFVALTNGGFDRWSAVSNDGLTWTIEALLKPSTYGGGVIFGNDAFWVYDFPSNTAITSGDGLVWAPRTLSGLSGAFGAIGYYGELFFGVGTGSAAFIYTSPDGINWSTRTMPVSAEWRSVTYGGGLFVAVAYNSSIAATSPDGITWTSRTLPFSSTWNSVTHGGKMFVATTYGGSVSSSGAVSYDGITWTARNLTNASTWGNVVYGDGLFVLGTSGLAIVNILIDIDIVDDNAPLLSAVATDLCSRAGLASGDINILALTNDAVDGYALTRPATVRANFTPIQKSYFFDAVESDNVLKFVKRGGAVLATIPFEDIGAYEYGSEPAEPLTIQRTQEVELPATVNVNFNNPESGYQLATESSRRLITPSKQQVVEQLAVALSPAKAAQIADVLMYDAHVSRNSFTFQTSRKYAKYEPTDIFTVTNGVTSYRVRATKKDESGPLVKWEAVADDATVYTSNATSGTQQVASTQITTPGPTRAEFLDIPIVQDTDDNAGFYVAMGGYRVEWSGATLFKSLDDSFYLAIGSALNNATIGSCSTILGTWPGGHFVDEKNTFDVTLTSGTLASITNSALLDGGNAAVVGDEIIQFRDAVLLSAGKYRISGLLRGLRGTEQHMGAHLAGERFVLLTIAGTIRPNPGASEIGVQRYYKPVSVGTSLSQAFSRTFTNNAVGLKPLSPVHLSGGRQINNDWIIGWTRRGRVDATWRNSVDVALGESTESYEVDVMSGSTVKRTITSATPEVTYTSAQQVTDFGANQTTITVNVYQKSATVGRGFAATRTY